MSDEPHIDYFNMGPWPSFVGFTTSTKAFKREMKRLGVKGADFLARDTANATVHNFASAAGCQVQIITAVPKGGQSTEQYVALIAHEALHVVQNMRHQLNTGDPFGDEAEAYLLQHIVQECVLIALGSNLVRSVVPA